jgi:hypothetical protein
MTPDQQRRRRAARAFIERGWHTLLLGPTRKPLRNCPVCRPDDRGVPNPAYQPHAGIADCPHPLGVCHGYQAASLDLDHVMGLLDRHPYANLGVSTGPSRLVVVDVDANRRGEPVPEEYAGNAGVRDGWDVLALVIEKYKGSWPDRTLMVSTPGKGLHLWFRLPNGVTVLSRTGRFGWLVDVKADKAYITCPGTRTNAGEYSRLGDVLDPVLAPDWLMRHLKLTGHFPEPKPPRQRVIRPRTDSDRDSVGQQRLDRIADTLETTAEGGRHTALCVATTAAAHLVAEGLVAENKARDAIADAARNCERAESEIAEAWRTALTKVGCSR